ncbi:MAG TPA: ferritin-like domain-containing protein [Bryobacteraceae bacterium]
MKQALLASTATAGAGMIGTKSASGQAGGIAPTLGDIAILQFLAVAEEIETDLWIQYAELGGVSAPANSYQAALQNLDGDGSQYISSNTLDEQSHASFLNAYLQAHGAPTFPLTRFHTLPPSQVTGVQQVGRLTTLKNLNVDTSWYTRYRSTTNPDFGATYPQAITLTNVPGIPRTNADLQFSNIQAIANIAAFHFGTIEQGGSSLYATMAQKVSSPEVLKIVLSIGGDEVAHFLEWVDFAGNGVQPPVAPIAAANGLPAFPDFNATGNPLLQTNLIFPVPCEFINANLPKCAVIRPTSAGQIDAEGAANAFIAMNIFQGQPKAFFTLLMDLAKAADAAHRIIL